MSEAERELPLAEAGAGRVLARAVPSKDGGTLLPAGTVLGAENLSRLRARGIARVWVVAAPPDGAAIEARIAYLFRDVDGQPGAERLRRALRVLRLGEGP